MRFYTFGNYYLSSLQQGLQGTHVLGEIDVKYRGKPQEKMVFDWKKNHKTIIQLNGGNSQQLAQLYATFIRFRNRGMSYPFAKFHEDEQSLGAALTCVGIVLPESIYGLCSRIRNTRPQEREEVRAYAIKHKEVSAWEWDLATLIMDYPLAK